jgi:hypothetical protein
MLKLAPIVNVVGTASALTHGSLNRALRES